MSFIDTAWAYGGESQSQKAESLDGEMNIASDVSPSTARAQTGAGCLLAPLNTASRRTVLRTDRTQSIVPDGDKIIAFSGAWGLETDPTSEITILWDTYGGGSPGYVTIGTDRKVRIY